MFVHHFFCLNSRVVFFILSLHFYFPYFKHLTSTLVQDITKTGLKSQFSLFKNVFFFCVGKIVFYFHFLEAHYTGAGHKIRMS